MGGRNHHHRRKNNRKSRQERNKNNRNNNNDTRRSSTTKDVDFVLNTVRRGNLKMETYYAVQGIHRYRWNHNNNSGIQSSLTPNLNLESWQAERLAWRQSLGSVLPASFRICQCPQVVSPSLQQQLEKELRDMLQQAAAWRPDVVQEEAVETVDKDTDNTIKDNNTSNDQKMETNPTEEVAEVAVETASAEAEAAEAATTTESTTEPTRTPVVWEALEEHETKLTKLAFADGGYYQLAVDRTRLRKHPAFASIQAWLVTKTDCGQVTRQEAVSMIPPLILLSTLEKNDKKNNKNENETGGGGKAILDMCAAPGSKTSQLLEGLASHHSQRAHENENDDKHHWLSTDTGLLVANDVNPSRANLLTHQLKRLVHHFPVAVVTAAPAQHIGLGANQKHFDWVLADVPCTGDGTSRKNIDVWRDWSQMGALALHKLQLDIAWKGVSTLVSPDQGLLCYSTCSQNPIENEAVVAELLRRSEGQLELVDARACLGSFLTRPGWRTWKVLCEASTRKEMKIRDKKWQAKKRGSEEKEEGKKELEPKEGEGKSDETQEKVAVGTSKEEESKTNGNGNEHKHDLDKTFKVFSPTSMDEESLLELATKEAGFGHYESMDQVPSHLQNRIRPSCFPPTEAEAEKMHLERCLRCLPQDNDTGGFFVALLKKTGPISGPERRRSAQQEKKRTAEELESSSAVPAESTTEDNMELPDNKKAKLTTDDEGKQENDVTMDGTEAGGTEEASKTKSEDGPSDSGNGRRQRGRRVEEYEPVPDELLDPLIEYYGLEGPGFRKDLFMSRGYGSSKIISYVAPSVKDMLFDQGGLQSRVQIISTGLKAFMKTAMKDSPVSHRIAQEAAHFLVPFMTKRKFSVSLEDMALCLRVDAQFMPLTDFSPEFAEHARLLEIGAFLIVLEGYEDLHHEKMVLVMWRCRGDNVNTLVGNAECGAIQSKLDLIKAEQTKTA